MENKDIEITFLGTGTSQGVPMIGCDCPVCTSTDPRDNRTRTSIYVKSPELSWVIDTGPDFRSQVLREKIHWLDAVVYTHSHTDHIMGFDDLRRYCDFLEGQIPVYGSAQTLEDLRRVFGFAFTGKHTFPGYIRPDPRVVDGPFYIGKTELTPLEVEHGRAHVFGYLFKRNGVKRFAYISDCKVVPEKVIADIRDVPVLVLDGLRHKPHPTHMNVAEALDVAHKARAGELILTHLCHDLGHAKTQAEVPHHVLIAFDGLKIRV